MDYLWCSYNMGNVKIVGLFDCQTPNALSQHIDIDEVVIH